MVLIENLIAGFKERQSIHNKTESTYFLVQDEHGSKYLQIDTYDSVDRAIPGKVSQSIQLSPNTVEQLKKIFENNF